MINKHIYHNHFENKNSAEAEVEVKLLNPPSGHFDKWNGLRMEIIGWYNGP